MEEMYFPMAFEMKHTLPNKIIVEGGRAVLKRTSGK